MNRPHEALIDFLFTLQNDLIRLWTLGVSCSRKLLTSFCWLAGCICTCSLLPQHDMILLLSSIWRNDALLRKHPLLQSMKKPSNPLFCLILFVFAWSDRFSTARPSWRCSKCQWSLYARVCDHLKSFYYAHLTIGVGSADRRIAQLHLSRYILCMLSSLKYYSHSNYSTSCSRQKWRTRSKSSSAPCLYHRSCTFPRSVAVHLQS